MSDKQEEIATWVYRTVIGVLSVVTVALVSSNYNDFRVMRENSVKQTVINENVEKRLTKLEK
jgi:hypothetical protein